MKLVKLTNVPIFEQLRLEEALLRAGTGEWCLLNTGSPPAFVIGISGKPEELIHATSLPVIRRFSGGGCVVVDESTLFVTFIGDMPYPTPSKVHAHIEMRLRPLFNTLPFALRENDYVLENKKFGGNAQYLAKERYLHHSSLLWSYDPQLMSLLKMPPKMPVYRAERPHLDFITSLAPHFPTKEAFFEKLIATLLPIETACTTELTQILATPHRQSLALVNL